MRDWRFWDWLGFGLLGLAATILALAQATREFPEMFRSIAGYLPGLFQSSWWSYAPILLFLFGALILLVSNLGLSRQRANQLKQEPIGGPIVFREPDSKLQWVNGFNILAFAEASNVSVYNNFHNEVGDYYLELVSNGRQLENVASASHRQELELKRYTLREKIQRTESAKKVALKRLVADVHAQLKSGHLISQGFRMPLDRNAKTIEIPHNHWRFLTLNDDFESASGQGIEYIGVAVARPE